MSAVTQMRIMGATVGLLIGGAAAVASATPVTDETSAIAIVRKLCESKSSEPWHASLVNGSWHVWQGAHVTEPTCGFFGATVDAKTGSTSECQIAICEMRRSQF